MSKSLEALDKILDLILEYSYWVEAHDLVKIIKQDLEAYEQLKQDHDKTLINNGELVVKVVELEKALNKACERLDWDCPVSQELIDDLDCENCKDEYKECWKIYFLKEVLK